MPGKSFSFSACKYVFTYPGPLKLCDTLSCEPNYFMLNGGCIVNSPGTIRVNQPVTGGLGNGWTCCINSYYSWEISGWCCPYWFWISQKIICYYKHFIYLIFIYLN